MTEQEKRLHERMLQFVKDINSSLNDKHQLTIWEQALLQETNEILKPLVDWEAEMQKCKDNPYYFYRTYMRVKQPDGTLVKPFTHLSEEEFNKFINKDT